jgi:hypothetical protein
MIICIPPEGRFIQMDVDSLFPCGALFSEDRIYRGPTKLSPCPIFSSILDNLSKLRA